MSTRGSEPNRRLAHEAVWVLTLVFFASLAPAQTAASLNAEGSRLLQAGDLEAALAKFREAAELSPRDAGVEFNVGLALFRLERYQEALPVLERSLAHPASELNARFLRGLIYYQANELERAAAELEHVRNHARYGERALYMLTESYRRTARIEESQKAFAELNARYPESAFVHQLMGIAYDSMHQPEEAIRSFKAALAADPRMSEAAFGAGYVRFKQNRLEEAATWFLKEIALDPCHALSQRYLGEIALGKTEYGEAARRFELSAKCDPRQPETYLGWGAAFERMSDLVSALAKYLKAAELQPDAVEAHYRTARVLRKLGRSEEANVAFKRVREMHAAQHKQSLADMPEAAAEKPE